MTCTVLVCDDEHGLAEHWVEAIRNVAGAEYTVRDAPDIDAVRESARELLHRRSEFRNGRMAEKQFCIFDDVDILVIDYDLLHVDEDNAQYTGEGLGRLARMFTECSVVVILNQYPQAQFDLRLRGNLESHADLNVDAELIGEPGLWQDPPWEGFRPWKWQTLFRAVVTQREREKVVEAELEHSILDTLGMGNEDVSRLSDSAFGFLSPNAESFGSLRDVTFRSFLENATDRRDAKVIWESNKDAAVRVVSARIGKWLEREVLGGQDLLIDIPHLLQRFPFVLGNKVQDLGVWNTAIHNEKILEGTFTKEAWFARSSILSRRAVWASKFQSDKEIRRRRSEFDFSEVPQFVFAEDLSEFVDLLQAREFRAGFHNAFDRRYIRQVDNIRYGPQRRLAFGS